METKANNYNISDLDISDEEETLVDEPLPKNLQNEQESLFVFNGVPKYEHFTREMIITMKIYYTLVYYIILYYI